MRTRAHIIPSIERVWPRIIHAGLRTSMAALGLFVVVLLAATARCSLGQRSLVINVTREGHNAPGCLQGRSNCSSIGYALIALGDVPASASAFTETTIIVYYSHSFSNASGIRLWQAENVSILGYGDPVINCSDFGVGIGFNGSANIYISGIHWQNCSVSHPTTAFLKSEPHLSFIRAYSALFFYNCSDVTVSQCLFTSERGSGISMYDVRGEVVIEYTDFLNHSVAAVGECHKTDGSNPSEYRSDNYTCSPQAVGLHIEFTFCGNFIDCFGSNDSIVTNANYSISSCLFEGNHNPPAYGSNPARLIPLGDPLEHWPFGRGGGLHLELRAYNVGDNLFSISDCNFSGNSALWGGGLFLKIISYEPYRNQITLAGCRFVNNKAQFSGGGIRLGMILSRDSYNTHQCCNNVLLKVVEFINNTAYWGGGLSIYNNPTRAPYFSLDIIRSAWHNNMALNSAAAVGLTKWESEVIANASTMIAIFCNCSFNENRLKIPVGNHSRLYGFGAVYTEGIPLKFCGNTLFYQNYESAVYISSTSVGFQDNVHFLENVGLLGGSLYLTGTAWIILYKGVAILFKGNAVFQYGGALYYTFPPSLSLNDSNSCFLTYVDPSRVHESIPLESWQVNITFTNNSATQAGDAVYVSNPRECTWEQGGNPFNVSREDKFVYLQDANRSVIATPAQKLHFQSAGVAVRDDGWYTYSVMPGEAFDLVVELLDYYDQPSSATVLSVRCHNVTRYEDYNLHDDLCDSSTIYDLHGVRVFTSNTTLSKFSVSGPQHTGTSDNSDFILVFKTDTSWPILAPLRIDFLSCRLGMVYNSSTHKCVCTDSRYITCMRTAGERTVPCINVGYWYGNISVTPETVYGIQICFADTGACGDCLDYCDESRSLCKIPVNESASCVKGWTGPLCSKCREGLQLGYDSYRCRKCTVGSKVGLVLLIVIYWIFVVAEIVVLLHLNVSVGSAGFYGFLYFYSVVRYYYVETFPFSVDPFISLLVSFTQLDPKYLAFTGFCLFDGVTPIQYEFLHYIHPVAISVLLYSLNKIDLNWHFKFKFLSGRGTIPATSVFLLISYTSLAETSMNILKPLVYTATYPDRDLVVVGIQPSTPYMHPTQHLPYAIIAILVECVLVIPFTLVMLLAPWLGKCFNLVRFKPILDEYQGCYKDEHRWFAGLYLLARQFMYFTIPSLFGLDLSTYLQQLVSFLLLTLHTTVQPYKTESKWLNRADTLLLLDLTLLSLNVGSTAIFSYYGSGIIRQGIIVVMAVFPCLLILAAVSFQAYKKVQACRRRQHLAAPLVSPIATVANPPSSDAESEADLPPLRSESRRWSHSWIEVESSPLLPPASRHSRSSQRGSYQAGASVDTPQAAGSSQEETKVYSDSKMLPAESSSSAGASRTTI